MSQDSPGKQAGCSSQQQPGCSQQQQPSQLMLQVLGRGLHIEISQQYSQDMG
jgi:hypothetical protein